MKARRTVTALAVTTATAAMVALGAAPPASAVGSTSVAAQALTTTASSRRADVDGDGKRDTVTVTQIGGRYRVTVKSATGKSASIMQEINNGISVGSPLMAVAPLDGAPGAEIVMSDGNGARAFWKRVYTWRKGRLVVENSPDRRDPGWQTDEGSGWRFYSSRGARYVDRIVTGPSSRFDPTYRGTSTTYRWSSGSWRRVASTRVSMRYDSRAYRNAVGWHGLRPTFW